VVGDGGGEEDGDLKTSSTIWTRPRDAYVYDELRLRLPRQDRAEARLGSNARRPALLPALTLPRPVLSSHSFRFLIATLINPRSLTTTQYHC
jgi:hypothetical protein